jgi:hypothetical protein
MSQNWLAIVLLSAICAEPAYFVQTKDPRVDLRKQLATRGGLREEKNTGVDVAFAYSNRFGDLLLSLKNDDGRSKRYFDRAICPDSKILEVKFAAEQKQGPHSTGRNSADNFDQDQGDRFAVLNGHAPGDGSCLLTDRGYLDAREILSVSERNKPCAPDVRARIPRLEKREVLTCHSVARFSKNVHFLAVEYRPEGENLLAAFIVLAGPDVYVHALPAKRGNDAWRVDDDGEFQPSYITAMFAVRKSDGSLEVAVDWPGAEGDDLMLLGATSQGRLQIMAQAYRYTAPG